MFKDIAAVLFDLDGTLIDSAPDLGAAADKMRTDRGLASLPLALYRPMAGAGARGMIAVAFGLTPDDARFPELKEEFFRNYEARMTEHTTVFDGVAELIARIGQAGFKWGVVTNKSARFTVPLTKAMPLFDTAQAIVSGDTTPLFDCKEIRARCAVYADDPRPMATQGVCAIHAVMLDAERRMREAMAGHTIADLAGRMLKKAPANYGPAVIQWLDDRSAGRRVGRQSNG